MKWPQVLAAYRAQKIHYSRSKWPATEHRLKSSWSCNWSYLEYHGKFTKWLNTNSEQSHLFHHKSEVLFFILCRFTSIDCICWQVPSVFVAKYQVYFSEEKHFSLVKVVHRTVAAKPSIVYQVYSSKTSGVFVHWIKCICLRKKLLICKSLSSDSCCMAFHCPPQFQTMAKILEQQQCWQRYIPWGSQVERVHFHFVMYLYCVILFENGLLFIWKTMERYISWEVYTFIL